MTTPHALSTADRSRHVHRVVTETTLELKRASKFSFDIGGFANTASVGRVTANRCDIRLSSRIISHVYLLTSR